MKYFLTHSKDIEKSSVIWNMIASVAMSFQSVILLIIISNTPGLGLVPAGIYTMGNTLNNFFLCIGKYGIRSFQVSDIKKEYSFKDYKLARIISVLAMALVSVVYVIYAKTANSYSYEKFVVILWMCIYKLPDAFEDVYYGEYQRNDRLDIASKATAIRFIFNIILWAVLIVTTKDMVISVCVTTVATIIIMFWFISITRDYTLDLHRENDSKTENIEKSDMIKGETKANGSSKALALLAVTAPLAVASTLAIYIGTAPRLSIDKLMDDSSQAVYGYIAMPVFVVQVFLMFILNPVIYKLSCLWNDKDYGGFIRETVKQVVMVIALTVLCIIGAWLLGIPVLSFLYHVDLKLYKFSLVLMMVGSGMLALSTVLQVLLTIMRKQKTVLAGYIIVSVVALIFSDKAVLLKGINGAAVFYMILLAILDVIYVIGFLYGLHKDKLA